MCTHLNDFIPKKFTGENFVPVIGSIDITPYVIIAFNVFPISNLASTPFPTLQPEW